MNILRIETREDIWDQVTEGSVPPLSTGNLQTAFVQ